MKHYDVGSAIIDFESGKLDDDATIDLFQHLVDSGLAWELQGFYGRMAMDLLQSGRIHPFPRPKES
jgi:hypothetical protein